MQGEDDTVGRAQRSARAAAEVEPLDDMLVVDPSDDEHETPAGLIIPPSSETPVRAGVVVAVGEEAEGVGPGDKVLFPKAAAIELRLGGEPVLLVRRGDLLARLG